jgi:hypothetical protein
MTNQHPITPSIELITTIVSNSNFDPFKKVATAEVLEHIITKAAQWGADQELEACCEWLGQEGWSGESRQLRTARRPKPPSLKEQALEIVKRTPVNSAGLYSYEQLVIIRRALEQLDDN